MSWLSDALTTVAHAGAAALAIPKAIERGATWALAQTGNSTLKRVAAESRKSQEENLHYLGASAKIVGGAVGAAVGIPGGGVLLSSGISELAKQDKLAAQAVNTPAGRQMLKNLAKGRRPAHRGLWAHIVAIFTPAR